MMNKKIIIAIVLIFAIILFGCQDKELKDDELNMFEDADKKSDAAIDGDIEKEFEDNLDEAIKELEEIENI